MKEKIKEITKKNFKWLVLFIALIGFLALAEDVFNKEIMNGDIIGYKIISTFLMNIQTLEIRISFAINLNNPYIYTCYK